MAQKPMAVLLDDDELILASWALAAGDAGAALEKFSTSTALMARVPGLAPDTIFYLDAQLGGGEKGELVARKLFDLGFRELHLVTGYPPEEFAHCFWLKSVRDKDPPWKK